MNFRVLAFLLVIAVVVGSAFAYVVLREPQRPTLASPVPCPPEAKGCAPGTRVDQPAPARKTPTSSADYHRPEESD